MKLKKNLKYINSSTQCDKNSFINTYYYPLNHYYLNHLILLQLINKNQLIIQIF